MNDSDDNTEAVAPPAGIHFEFSAGVEHVHCHSYTNWKGERSPRFFKPMAIYYGSNEWHPEPQWLMDAWDMEKKARRTFALNGFLEDKS